MSRTAVAIFGLVGVAGINVLGPAVAQRISHVVGYEQQGHTRGGDLQLASGAGDSRPGDHAGWDSHTLLDGR
jgi:hypothetical protein